MDSTASCKYRSAAACTMKSVRNRDRSILASSSRLRMYSSSRIAAGVKQKAMSRPPDYILGHETMGIVKEAGTAAARLKVRLALRLPVLLRYTCQGRRAEQETGTDVRPTRLRPRPGPLTPWSG